MIRVAGAALLLLVSTGNGDDQARQPPPRPGVTVHQQFIIRVSPIPRAGNRMGNIRQNVAWQEERGPRCIPVRQILGAAQIGQESIDLVLRDATRIRARLERRCVAMDYYFGVYVRPNADGMICADRDEFRARSGGSCGIERFRLLRPREP
ncbi:MAG TPA: hypothetical protein VEC11_08965 [Allosphingosinicella sp.]|nr:hypothetical protein [Allosphingosinicella sp.]